MNKIMVGAAVIAIATVTFAGAARAACYWNGYNWHCAAPQVYVQPYAYQLYGYQRDYQPYYGYSQPNYYGYQSNQRYPGPRPSGGGGDY